MNAGAKAGANAGANPGANAGALGKLAAVLLVLLAPGACGPGPDQADASEGEGAAADAPVTEARADVTEAATAVIAAAHDTIPGTAWTREDWRIFEEKVRWAAAEGLDTLPAGEAIARLGVTFVGTTYTPGTLEAPGPEHLVVNLRELDCVTFIETVVALTRFVRHHGVTGLEDAAAARDAYEGYLRQLRYRNGELDGYASRLHYFSDWLTHHENRGFLALIAEQLGGVPDPEPVDFMSTHPDAYRQLADPEVLDQIRRMEARLSAAGPRTYLPQAAIGDAASGIRDGDIIAATSTVAGLDIAHTGLALWVDGRLHLLHAPLVGRSVEISEVPLAQRIAGIGGQDGIMVGRIIEDVF